MANHFLSNPSERTLKCIVSIKPNRDFIEFMSYLRNELEKIDVNNRTAQLDKVPQNQGAARVLSDIFDIIDNADGYVQKIVIREREKGLPRDSLY